MAPGRGKAKAGMLLKLCLSLLSLPKAKRKLDLEGIGRPTVPEFRTPKGKCIRVDGLPSPKSKIPTPMGYYLRAGWETRWSGEGQRAAAQAKSLGVIFLAHFLVYKAVSCTFLLDPGRQVDYPPFTDEAAGDPELQ